MQKKYTLIDDNTVMTVQNNAVKNEKKATPPLPLVAPQASIITR